MRLKQLLLTVLATALASAAAAQTMTREEYIRRYNNLTARVGAAGVGVETLLDKWEADWPEDLDLLSARMLYYYAKSQTSEIVIKDRSRFLGEQPTLSLKDSLGNEVNYFQESFYDDELFGRAVSYAEKAIQLAPDRLDLRRSKIALLVSYEKESPDMALSDLKTLIDYDASRKPAWQDPELGTIGKEEFEDVIQEYCYVFFRYATPRSYDAFRDISLRMLDYDPDNVRFLNNLGSYFLVARKDNKTALKYYNKVLKIKKDDLTAIRNCLILARNTKDVKLEKKYLPMMVKYAETDTDRLSAQARLDYFNGKK